MSTTLDTMSFQGPDGFLFVLRQVHWQAVGFVKVLPMIMLFWHPVLSFSFNGFIPKTGIRYEQSLQWLLQCQARM